MSQYIPPPAIVALISESNSSSPLMANCKWRGVIRLTFRSLLALPANSRTCKMRERERKELCFNYFDNIWTWNLEYKICEESRISSGHPVLSIGPDIFSRRLQLLLSQNAITDANNFSNKVSSAASVFTFLDLAAYGDTCGGIMTKPKSSPCLY